MGPGMPHAFYLYEKLSTEDETPGHLQLGQAQKTKRINKIFQSVESV